MRNQPRRCRAARHQAAGKSTVHRVDREGAKPLRRVLRHHGDGRGHRRAESQSRQKAQRRQGGDRLRVCRDERPRAEGRHCRDEHGLAANAIRHRPCEDRAEAETGQRRAHDDAEFAAGDPPLLGKRRRDEADRRGVVSVCRHDEEAEYEDQPLARGKAFGVDERLHVDRAGCLFHRLSPICGQALFALASFMGLRQPGIRHPRAGSPLLRRWTSTRRGTAPPPPALLACPRGSWECGS